MPLQTAGCVSLVCATAVPSPIPVLFAILLLILVYWLFIIFGTRMQPPTLIFLLLVVTLFRLV